MGKPSSSSLSRNSECSTQSNSSKQKNKGAMSAHKMEQIKKKNHKHVRRSINKLFNKLQRDSIGSRTNSRDHTQSSLDSTPRNLTIVVKNDSFTPQRERKSLVTVNSGPSKSRRKSDSLIVINDDDFCTKNDSCILISPTKNTPQNNNINCSTPIAKRDSQTLQNIIIQRKRKSPVTVNSGPSKSRRKSDSLIVINDDNLSTNNDSCLLISPTKNTSQNNNINCSTPIAKRDKHTLQNLIINNFPKTKSLSCTQSQNETKEEDRTKVINKDSYLTIDLTAESENKTNANVTVIDVDKSADCTNDIQDCTLASVSNASLSMSGDSDVTVIQNNRNSKKQIRKFTNGIAQLNPNEKANLLKFIAQKIFSGCDLNNGIQNAQIKTSCGTETDEDAYIKEVILGESKTQGTAVSTSRNSIGSNIYHPSTDVKNTTGLRMVVIDGSNVAMEHTKGRMFSVEGLKICIDYFIRRGHVVKAFVPRFRCKFGKSTDPNLLDYLERQSLVVYTPSREIQGKNCVPYDDRYILQCAAEFDGVVVSGDNYRDLINENKRWRYVIENRILPFTWVNNMIMFPKDPFGRGGPTLENLLRHPTPSNIRTDNK